MKYKIKMELLLPGNNEPVGAGTEHLDEKSISRLAETFRRQIAGSGKETTLNQALEHLYSIAPEWTFDFLNSM
jgi:hypothetical protein